MKTPDQEADLNVAAEYACESWQEAQAADEAQMRAEIEEASGRLYVVAKDCGLIADWAKLTWEAGADPETVIRQVKAEAA